MTNNVHRFAARYAPRGEAYTDHRSRAFDYAPGNEDAGRPKRRRRGLLPRLMFLLATFGIGWTIYDDPKRVGQWWSVANEKIVPVVARLLEPSPSPPPAVAETEPASAREIGVAGSATGPVVAAPRIPAVTQGTAQAPEDGAMASGPAKPQAPKIIAALQPIHSVARPPALSEPAPPAAAQKTEPKRDILEVRAQSVGLHPKLSRALLSRLSKTDFRNAGYAVRTALAKTADGATFRWPRRRKAGLAMFEVRFVPGAAKGCRRYVVTVEKNRWLTTALPIEKCGVRRPQPVLSTKS